MSMAGWRCFHMCALLIFFLSCEELVLLLFPHCLLCIQVTNAARWGAETEPEPRSSRPIGHLAILSVTFSKRDKSWISHHSLQSISKGLSCTFPIALSWLFHSNTTYSFRNGLQLWRTYNYQATAQAAWPKFNLIYYRHKRRTCTWPAIMLSVACMAVT